MSRAGVVTPADKHALELYCFTYAAWRESIKAVKKHGTVMTHSTGSKQISAEFTVAKTLMDQLLKLSREFGLTPSSRTSIQSMIESEDSSLDDLMFG